MSNRVLDKAISYVARGWSVIPVTYKDKRPSIISWKEYQTRLPSAAELRGWFSSGDPKNLAVVTGAVSNLVVLDFDGEDGAKTLSALGLRSSLISGTGEGRHLFYSRPETGVGNSVKSLPGMDIRGDGGYVLVEPSIHPSGRPYRWIVDSGPLLPLPPIVPVGRDTTTSRNPTGWVVPAIANMRVGNIDNTLFKVLSKLRRDGYRKEEAFAILKPHADAAGATEGHLPDKIEHVWASYHPESEAIPAKVLVSMSGSELLASKNTTEWVVPGYIPKGGITFLVGMQGIGKTWMALDLAVCLVTDRKPWLDRFDVTQGSRVFYMDDESSAALLSDRIKLISHGRGADLSRLSFVIKSSVDVLNESDFGSLSATILESSADVVVMDSYSCFHSGDDCSSDHTLKVMKALKKLVSELGVTLIIVDHMSTAATFRKASENVPVSSNDVAGNKIKARQADSMLNVMKKEGLITVHHTKARYSEERPAFIMELTSGDGFIRPVAHPI